MRCIECGGDVKLSSADVLYKVRGEAISVQGIEHYRCSSCGEEEFNAAQSEALRNSAHETYRALHGLLSPEEIKSIRDSFGLTQEEFEKVADFGKTTMSRWENGFVMQSSPANTLLRVFKKRPAVFLDLAKEQGVNVSTGSHLFFSDSFYPPLPVDQSHDRKQLLGALDVR